MTKINFNGDWSYEVKIPVFEGFQSRKGAYTSIDSPEKCDGTITVQYEDDLSDNPDPYPEQFEAFDYFIDNQGEIMANIINQILQELPEIIINYDLQEDPKYTDLTKDKIKSLIGFSTLEIKIPSKDGISYIDLSGGCDWDEEHGLNILFHKERVLKVSGIDGSSYWDAIKDNGTYEDVKERMKTKTIPKKYKPHAKYNKLKPSQKFENETFEHSLISGGHNHIFMDLVDKGEIDINGKWESQNKTFLEAACWFKNNEIVEFLLNKGADIRYALHQCIGLSYNPKGYKLLLKYGADINQKGLAGNTIIRELIGRLAQTYSHLAQDLQYNWGRESELRGEITNKQDLIKELITLGANPLIKNDRGNDCFIGYSHLSEKYQNEITGFLKDCINEIAKDTQENIETEQVEKSQEKKTKKWKFWKK